MVRSYQDQELINRVKSLPSYKHMPKLLLIGVRSKEDRFNEYDDKFYFFVDGLFYAMTTGTTNPGDRSLLGGWKNVNKHGSAIIKSDEIYYDVYAYGLHKQKMPALRQREGYKMKYLRDGNNDRKVDETGQVFEEVANTNFHFNNYNILDTIKKAFIGGWSEGCQVANDSVGYNKIINYVKAAKLPVTYALLKEF